MAKNISLSTIKSFKNKFLRNNKNTASRNALIKNDLANVALKKNFQLQTKRHLVDVGVLRV